MAQDTRHRSDDDPPNRDDAAVQEALAWFARLRADDASAADRRGFRAWYDADPAHRDAYRRVQALWQAPELDRAARALDRPADPARRPWRRRMLAVAASLLLLAGLGAAFDLPLRLQADHMTVTGEQRRIALADGSSLLLDSASAVAVGLRDDGRRVRLLQGRAYFEVASAPQRPFRVEAGDATVQVTGTAFAVARAGDATTVTLRHGRLRVRANGATAELNPGERLRAGADGPGAPTRVPFRDAAGWVDGRLAFRDRRLGTVVDELARYHRGLIVVADRTLADVRISGNYRLADPVATLAQLARLTDADLTRLSDRLLILH